MPKTMTNPTPAEAAAIDAQRAVHDAADAAWLVGLLFPQAEQGDPRARRMLSRLHKQLRAWGATVTRTWAPAWAPERRREFGL